MVQLRRPLGGARSGHACGRVGCSAVGLGRRSRRTTGTVCRRTRTGVRLEGGGGSLWRHVLVHKRRWIHALVVGELRSVGILLGVRVSDGLIECTPHGYMVRQVGRQPPVEIGGAGLQVRRQPSVLHRQVVVLLLIHLFIDHILLGDSQGAPCATLVDLGCSACRFDSGFQTAITSS